jgi:hypothetical protein
MVPGFPQQRVVQAGYQSEFAASSQAMRVGRLATILPAGAEGDSEDLRAGRQIRAAHSNPIRHHKYSAQARSTRVSVRRSCVVQNAGPRPPHRQHGPRERLRHTQSQHRMDTLSACEPLFVL